MPNDFVDTFGEIIVVGACLHEVDATMGRSTCQESRCKATWKRELPWHETGSPDHHDDIEDPDL